MEVLQAELNIPNAKKLKQYRKEMGMRQNVAAEILGVNQGNYSKMESGQMKVSEERLNVIRTLFIVWRQNEVKALLDRVEYLKSIK